MNRPSPQANSPHVMVVEDNEGIRSGLLRFFRRRDESACAFSTMAEAMTALDDMQPRVLVTDWDLPEGGSGIEVARELRRRCPEAHIVLVSGQPMHLLKAHCTDLHIDAFVRKPFTLKALTEALPVTDLAQVASVPDSHVKRSD